MREMSLEDGAWAFIIVTEWVGFPKGSERFITKEFERLVPLEEVEEFSLKKLKKLYPQKSYNYELK